MVDTVDILWTLSQLGRIRWTIWVQALDSRSAIKSVVCPKKWKWRRWRQIQIRRWKMFVKSLRCKLNDFRQGLYFADLMNLDCIWFILNKPRGANYKGTQAQFAETKGNWMLCSAMSKSAETMVCRSLRRILMWIRNLRYHCLAIMFSVTLVDIGQSLSLCFCLLIACRIKISSGTSPGGGGGVLPHMGYILGFRVT